METQVSNTMRNEEENPKNAFELKWLWEISEKVEPKLKLAYDVSNLRHKVDRERAASAHSA